MGRSLPVSFSPLLSSPTVNIPSLSILYAVALYLSGDESGAGRAAQICSRDTGGDLQQRRMPGFVQGTDVGAPPSKQRLNARNIWEYLQGEKAIAIAQSTVRRYVRELRERHPEVFLPLDHEPGEAMQFDWGDMSAVIAGDKITVSVFCAVLPYSGALCAFVYPDKSTLSFLHGHIQAFEFFGGVARHCVYDNLKTAVKKGSGKNAVKQDSFIRLEAHYGFEAVFCNAASGWEKSYEKCMIM